MIKSIIIITILAFIVFTQQPPIFPNQFQIDFNQTAKVGVVGGNTTGKIIYDYVNLVQVVTRQNGRHDRYCGTVQKFSNTPCNHYIVNGNRYLDFPTKKYCCYCCNSTNGCGILRPDWMSAAQYLGIQKLQNKEYQKWNIKGLQNNYYYNTNDQKRIPRRLDQSPDDLMDFDINSYFLGIRDPSILKLPSYCTQKCGLTTICATLRGQKSQLRSQ